VALVVQAGFYGLAAFGWWIESRDREATVKLSPVEDRTDQLSPRLRRSAVALAEAEGLRYREEAR
jgi:hypothetical protein